MLSSTCHSRVSPKLGNVDGDPRTKRVPKIQITSRLRNSEDAGNITYKKPGSRYLIVILAFHFYLRRSLEVVGTVSGCRRFGSVDNQSPAYFVFKHSFFKVLRGLRC